MTIRRGDILWADLGMFPTTSVQGGVRPVIVVSNNKAKKLIRELIQEKVDGKSHKSNVNTK